MTKRVWEEENNKGYDTYRTYLGGMCVTLYLINFRGGAQWLASCYYFNRQPLSAKTVDEAKEKCLAAVSHELNSSLEALTA